MNPISRRALVVGSILALSPARAQEAERTRLRVADIQSSDFPSVQALYFIDRYMRSKLNAPLALQVFSGAQLGDESEIVEQTRAGAVDLARINIGSLAEHVPLCSLFCAPGLIQSDEHLRAIIDSEFRQQIAAAIEDAGIILLALYQSGPRFFYNRKGAIEKLADFHGLSITVQDCEVIQRFVRALDAVPVELGFGQVLPALQASVIDGAESTLVSYVTSDHYRVAPYLTLTEHSRPPDVLVISKARWVELQPKWQEALMEASKASEGFMRLRWSEWQSFSRDSLSGGWISASPPPAELSGVMQMVREDWAREKGLTAVSREMMRQKP